MVDPVLVSVAGVGASVVKFLLRASDRELGADLVGDAQEGLGLLARLRGRVNDRNGAVAKRIEKTVAGRVRGMYQKCRDQGVGTERLDGVATEVEKLVDRVATDESLILEAVRFPDGFAALLHDLGEPIRATLFEQSEPYFNELVDAVAGEYVRLAPWSPNFKIEALKYVMGALGRIEEGVDEVRVGVSKGLENDQVTHGKLDVLLARSDPSTTVDARPGQVLFGGRPDVASGFVERGEQGRLRSLVIDERQGRTVLVGMAGCGKSQVASALAQWCEEAGWGVVAWVNAETKAAVKSDLVELANRLGIDTSDRPPEIQVIGRCLDHLKSPALGDRLVIFDNVEDFEDLADLVPQGAGLRVVATARSRETSSAWEPVEVGLLPRPDSINLVQKITGSQDDGAADALAERLGDLPLALAQAAETTRIERWTLAECLAQLDAYASDRVIHRIPDDSYADDVSIALLLAADSTLGRIRGRLRDTARRQLGALAVLAESGVPTRWLNPRADAGKTDKDAGARDAAADNARCALTALLNASVVQQTADKGVTMVHRLQAQVLRENWNPEEWAEAFDAAAGLLGQVNIDRLPRKDTDGRRRETLDLIDQLRAIAAQDYSRPLFEREQARVCLPRVFVHANDLGLPSEALTLRNAVSVVKEVTGRGHPDTLASRNGIAGAYQRAGRPNEAIPLYEEVLADCARVLGADHPQTLTSRNNLALAYQRAGRLNDAIAVFEEVVANRVRTLEPNHPHTLTSRNNLAVAYHTVGRLNEAIPLYEKVFADTLMYLGPEHPNTLTSRNNLALAYESAGRVDEAITQYEELLADSASVLGPDHPDTLTSRNNLAGAYESAGRLDKAIAVFEEVLADRVRILSADHPDTLTSRNNLACAYESAGDLDEAVTLFEDVLADRLRILGPDHPHTLASRNNLAGAYQGAGRLNEAITLFEDVLADRLRILGPDHPHTLSSGGNLAGAYQAMGRTDEAIALFEDVLTSHLRVLGPDHPHTLTSQGNLAYAYQGAGRLGEAISVFGEVLQDCVRVLGPNHPDTLTNQFGLALAYVKADRVDDARALFKDTLEVCEEALSPGHPLTITVRENLETLEREMNPAPASSPEASEE